LGIAGLAGIANAYSSATTINGNTALAQSTASGSGGRAQATAQTNFGNFKSVQSMATSQVGGTPAAAIAQAGGIVSLSNAIIPGQSYSLVSGFAFGPLTVTYGSMGAGGTGASLTYQETVNFIFSDGTFLLDLLKNASLGDGFDSAVFQITSNGNLIDSQSFTDLASAQAFFSNHLIDIPTTAGPNDVQLIFDETMSGGEGFSFDYAAANVSNTPLPSSATMMLIGLAGLGFVAYRRTKKGSPAIAAA